MASFNPVSIILAVGFIIFGAVAVAKRESLAGSMATKMPFGDQKFWRFYMWFVGAFALALAAVVLIFSRTFFG